VETPFRRGCSGATFFPEQAGRDSLEGGADKAIPGSVPRGPEVDGIWRLFGLRAGGGSVGAAGDLAAGAAYRAPSRAIARELAAGVAADYDKDHDRAVACFMEDFEACIAQLRFPVTHRRAIRTTNWRRGVGWYQSGPSAHVLSKPSRKSGVA